VSQAHVKKLDLRVSNLDCEHDAAAIQRGLADFSGLDDLKVYPKSAKVAVTYDPTVTSPETLKEKLETLGFPPQTGLSMPEQPKPWRNPKVLTSVASGALLLIGWLIGLAGAPEIVSFIFYIAAILIGGYYFGREAIEGLVFERKIGIELLMTIAAIVATVMGQAAEGAMLVFLYSISEAAEGYTEEKTRSAVKALMDLAPKVALVRRNGREMEVPVEDVTVGDVFIVKPGQSVATDSEIIEGASSVNQAPVTGESVPVEKEPGDTVFAGSINAQERKGQSQRFIERFGARYSPLVLLAGILIAIVPPILFGADWATWINRATVFIVAAAPCALVISIPITLVASLGTGARQGVLIKGGMYLEELAKVKVVAMDKTGTLTRGEPEVTDVIAVNNGSIPKGHDMNHEQVLALAAGMERRSQHPLAQAIVRHAEAQAVAPVEINDFRSLTGAGVSARRNGQAVYVGSPDFFRFQLGQALDLQSEAIQRLQAEGKTVVVIGDETSAWGLVAIRDNIRPNAHQSIEAMHAAGVDKVAMLTGDNERTAQAIARELDLDEVYADLKPEDKVTRVRKLAERYGHVAMVGDGVNDAPALAEATVGIAMGAAGTDVALETADVALMADDLEKLAYALTLAKRNQKIVTQNLVLALGVISVLVIGAIGGLFTLPMAVLGHEISEFVVIGNGLRMLRA
jgi:Cd2+/Zn2+-exporting ATPase